MDWIGIEIVHGIQLRETPGAYDLVVEQISAVLVRASSVMRRIPWITRA